MSRLRTASSAQEAFNASHIAAPSDEATTSGAPSIFPRKPPNFRVELVSRRPLKSNSGRPCFYRTVLGKPRRCSQYQNAKFMLPSRLPSQKGALRTGSNSKGLGQLT